MALVRHWCKQCGSFIREQEVADSVLAEIRKLPLLRPLKTDCDDCIKKHRPKGGGDAAG